MVALKDLFRNGRNKQVPTIQVTMFKKYKSWNPKAQFCIVIVLSCLLIGCLATERAIKRAITNKLLLQLLIKSLSLEVLGFVLLNLCQDLAKTLLRFIKFNQFSLLAS